MLKFDEKNELNSVNGALAIRLELEKIVDEICNEGYKNICWLGIGGTYASCLQAEVHMKEYSALNFLLKMLLSIFIQVIKKLVKVPL